MFLGVVAGVVSFWTLTDSVDIELVAELCLVQGEQE